MLLAEVAAVCIEFNDVLGHVVHAVHEELEALFQVVAMATDRQIESLVEQSLREERSTAHQSVIAHDFS